MIIRFCQIPFSRLRNFAGCLIFCDIEMTLDNEDHVCLPKCFYAAR